MAQSHDQRLRTEGFNAEELQAAQMAGLTDDEVAASLAERIALDPADRACDLMDAGREAAEAMRELGARWAALPRCDLDL